eukprot:COSAG01_NODE_1098_length_11703_cov_1483.853844_8_plen_279_part_00
MADQLAGEEGGATQLLIRTIHELQGEPKTGALRAVLQAAVAAIRSEREESELVVQQLREDRDDAITIATDTARRTADVEESLIRCQHTAALREEELKAKLRQATLAHRQCAQQLAGLSRGGEQPQYEPTAAAVPHHQQHGSPTRRRSRPPTPPLPQPRGRGALKTADGIPELNTNVGHSTSVWRPCCSSVIGWLGSQIPPHSVPRIPQDILPSHPPPPPSSPPPAQLAGLQLSTSQNIAHRSITLSSGVASSRSFQCALPTTNYQLPTTNYPGLLLVA